jgi:hypothetical protein
MDEPAPKKRRKRRKPSEADISIFIRGYGRRGASPSDANDRHYSHRIKRFIKTMRPEELDSLLHDDGDPDGVPPQ